MSVDSVGPEERPERDSGDYVGVGASLRQSRVESGRDLSEASEALRIRRPHLQAIEEGRFDELPGQAYALGFVRAYAEYLELDSDWVIDRFREEVDPGDANQDLHFPEPPPVRDWRPRIGVAGAALALAAVAYGGWYYVQNRGEPRDGSVSEAPPDLLGETAPAPPAETGPQAGATDPDGSDPAATVDALAVPGPPLPESTTPETSPETGLLETAPGEAIPPERPPVTSLAELAEADTERPVDEPPVVPEDVAAEVPDAGVDEADETEAAEASDEAGTAEEGTVYGAANAGGRVVLRAVRESWISVRGPNGERVFTRLLRPGDSYRVPARADLSMIVGNAGGLAVEVDGVTLPPLGEEGRTRRDVSLDPDALTGALP